MKTFTLNNQVLIPQVGLGCNTFGKENKDYSAPLNYDTTEINNAITVGYRHLDTAISYRTESVIGKALLENKLPRSEFFLTSKIPGRLPYILDDKSVDAALESSLEGLGVDYIDLYLIHHPWDNLNEMLQVWKRLEYHYQKGTIKAIGVSNFTEEILTDFLNRVTVKPAVNQIESNLGNFNHELVAFCLDNDILPVAYSPLKKATPEKRAVLSQIGEKYQKSWAQVLLRYQTLRNVAVIPKSFQITHQRENIEIFDFTLTKAEIDQISAL